MTATETTETPTTEARRYDVPVIYTVTVDVDENGATRTVGTSHADSEGGPWAFSGYPSAYQHDNDWHDFTSFPDAAELDDQDARGAVEAWRHAYDTAPAIADNLAARLAALDRIGQLVSLPEWNIRGDMCDWIEAVADAVHAVGLGRDPLGLCECGQFRPDRVSDDGTWSQEFSTECPSCGRAADVEPEPEPISWRA